MDILKHLELILEDKKTENKQAAFLACIAGALKETNLAQFWLKAYNYQGDQLTLLNYLILKHNAEKLNLMQAICFVLETGASRSVGQPLHLALKLGKVELLDVLLHAPASKPQDVGLSDDDDPTAPATSAEGKPTITVESPLPMVDNDNSINALDIDSRTLLSRAIELLEDQTFETIIHHNSQINIHAPSKIKLHNKEVVLQPLHQAAIAGWKHALTRLLACGAQQGNTCGTLLQTPLMLAASALHLDCMAELLDHPTMTPEILNQVDADERRAIDLVCEQLNSKKSRAEALQGIAILLCHGALMPQSEDWRQLLQENRLEIIEAIKQFTADKPALLIKFAESVHNKDNIGLHELFYNRHSCKNSFLGFFGKINQAAFEFETLVADAADQLQASGAQETFDDDTVRFARFVRDYRNQYNKEWFTNPKSTMRRWIADGEVTKISEVDRYVNRPENQNTRTWRMFQAHQPASHEGGQENQPVFDL